MGLPRTLISISLGLSVAACAEADRDPVQVADMMEEWVTMKACDGFNIMPPVFPGSLVEFVDLVIPELQRRGLFRTRYEGTTLRANLGLTRPKWS